MGSEDHGELVRDATASTAEMIKSMEKSGREPLPHSIAYYSIQRTKSGRRSYGDMRCDVMSPGYQMDHEGSLCSMQAPVCEEEDSTVGDTIPADAGQESVWERDIRCLREKGEWKYMKVDRIDDSEVLHAQQELFG